MRVPLPSLGEELGKKGYRECHERARHEAASWGEAREEARLLQHADLAGIAESRIILKTIAGRKEANVCVVEAQTTSLLPAYL